MKNHLVLICAVVLLGNLSCSTSEQGAQSDWDPGPPPRPIFFEIEGLKWGLTPEEVKEAWGAPVEDGSYQMTYKDKSGYPEASLMFMSVPEFRNVHKDVVRAESSENPYYFLISVTLMPNDETTSPKDTFRAELVERFGEPLTDPALYEVNNLNPEQDEIFRAAECTLCIPRWTSAPECQSSSEILRYLTYRLAPQTLVTEVPRSRWQDLRGSIPPRAPANIKAPLESLHRIQEGAAIDQIIKELGSPNLFLEESKGNGKLFYFWLTGSNLTFNIAEGKNDGHKWTFFEEDLR